MKYLLLLALFACSCKPDVIYNVKLKITYFDSSIDTVYHSTVDVPNITLYNGGNLYIEDRYPSYCGVRKFEILNQEKINEN
jgi:hypothetical protein